jgi:hypothetical protein
MRRRTSTDISIVMCGCTNKKYLLYSHWLSDENLIFQLYTNSRLRKKFETFETFFLTDIQTFRKIAGVD